MENIITIKLNFQTVNFKDIRNILKQYESTNILLKFSDTHIEEQTSIDGKMRIYKKNLWRNYRVAIGIVLYYIFTV